MPDGHTVTPDLGTIAPVRIAKSSDADPLMRLLTGPHGLYHDSAAGLGVSMSPPRVLEFVESACSGRGGIAGIIGTDTELVASVGIFPWRPWYSEDWILCEYWLFVDPTHRRHGYFDDLWRFSDWHVADMSRRLGRMIPLQSTIVTSDRLDQKIKIWKRKATHIGAVFASRGDQS